MEDDEFGPLTKNSFQDAFDIPADQNKMNEIKIVPYGNFNDPDGIIKDLDNYRNTYSR